MSRSAQTESHRRTGIRPDEGATSCRASPSPRARRRTGRVDPARHLPQPPQAGERQQSGVRVLLKSPSAHYRPHIDQVTRNTGSRPTERIKHSDSRPADAADRRQLADRFRPTLLERRRVAVPTWTRWLQQAWGTQQRYRPDSRDPERCRPQVGSVPAAIHCSRWCIRRGGVAPSQKRRAWFALSAPASGTVTARDFTCEHSAFTSAPSSAGPSSRR